MKIKSIIFLFLSLISASYSTIYASAGPSKPPVAAPPAGMPELSEQDMKMFEDFISSLDQETIDALTAIGEEIIKEADELGIDPFDYIELQAQLQEDFEKEAAAAPEKPAPTKPAEPEKKAPVVDLSHVQMLKDLIRLIGDIRQKAANNKDFSNDLIPFKYRLDDLVYYLNLLTSEKLIKFLSDKEFEPLLTNLKELHTSLSSLEPQLTIEEFSLEGKNPYEVLNVARTATQDEIVTSYQKLVADTNPQLLEVKLIRQGKTKDEIDKALSEAKNKFTLINGSYAEIRNQEESRYIFDQILYALSKATDERIILEDIKKLFKKHDPEALKAQQEREKLEAEARKAQEEALKKRALPGRMVFSMPPPQPPLGGYEPPLPGGEFGFPAPYESFNANAPLAPPASAGIKPRGGEGSAGEKKAKEEKKKKKKDKKKKKEEEKKKGEETTKAGDKKAQAELSSKVSEQVGIIKRKLKDFSSEITDNKDLFGWKFKELMTTPVAKPYSEEALKKISDTKAAIVKITNILTDIPNKIMRDAFKKEFKDNKADLAAYKKAVVQEFKDFEKKKRDPEKPQELTAYELIEPVLKFDATKQLQPKVDAGIQPLDPVAVFALTGDFLPGTQAGLNLNDSTDLEAAKLNQINPLKEEETKEIDPITGLPKKISVRTNAIKQLKDTYKAPTEKAED